MKHKKIVAVTDGGFWGVGNDLEEAISNCRAEGATGTQQVVIYLYTAKEESLLQEVGIDQYGSISYPEGVESTRIGMVKIPMKQERKQ
jgi:hypothetical protein